MFPVNIDWWIFHFRGYEGHWALGILIFGYFYQKKRSLEAGYSLEWYNNAWSAAIITGFIFAKLFHFAFWDTKNFLQNPLIVFTSTGGFAILGGTIGTAFGAWVYCKYTNKNFLHWCDSLMIPLTFGLAISRMSCFLNGDAYGLPTSSILGVTFSENSDAWMYEWNKLHSLYANHEEPLNVISNIFKNFVNLSDIPLSDSMIILKEKGYTNLAELAKLYPPTATGNYQSELKSLGLIPFPVIYPKVHPTQIYEMVILFFVLILMYKIETYSWTKNKMFFLFWIFYSLNRFIIEFFRGDRNIAFLNFTYAQVTTLIILFLSIIGLIYFVKFSNKETT